MSNIAHTVTSTSYGYTTAVDPPDGYSDLSACIYFDDPKGIVRLSGKNGSSRKSLEWQFVREGPDWILYNNNNGHEPPSEIYSPDTQIGQALDALDDRVRKISNIVIDRSIFGSYFVPLDNKGFKER